MARLVTEASEISSSAHDAVRTCEATSMSSACDSVQVELNVRKRILRQNRELARSNSNFSTRIAEQEKLISSLRQENLELQLEIMELRRSGINVGAEQIETLRNNVSEKFCDILSLFDQLKSPFHSSGHQTEREVVYTTSRDARLEHFDDREVSCERVSRTNDIQLYNNPDYNLSILYEDCEGESASNTIVSENITLEDNDLHNRPGRTDRDERNLTGNENLQLSNDHTHRSKKRRKSSNQFPYITSSTQAESGNNELMKSSCEEMAERQESFDNTTRPDYLITACNVQHAEQTHSTQLKSKSFSRLRQKASPMANEQMPQNNVLENQAINRDGDEAFENSIERRSTGRSRRKVNYALPSLRTKMRRSNNQLVDAVSSYGGPLPLGEKELAHTNMKEKDAVLTEKQTFPEDGEIFASRKKRSYSECLESDASLRRDRDREFDGKENKVLFMSGKTTKASPLKKAKSLRRKTTHSVLTERQIN